MTDNGIEPTGFKTGIEQVGDAEIVFFVETILAGGSGVVTGQSIILTEISAPVTLKPHFLRMGISRPGPQGQSRTDEPAGILAISIDLRIHFFSRRSVPVPEILAAYSPAFDSCW